MKKFVAFIVALVMLCSVTAYAHPFTDVRGHWAEAQLDIAYNNGMINGDPDGRFRPDDNISRAEYLKMLTAVTAKWLGIPDSEINRFADGSHWASKYYNFALHQGWIINYSYDTGDPEYEAYVNAVKVGDILPGNMNTDNFDIPIERWELAYMASRFAHSLCGVAMSKKANTGFADYNKVMNTFPETVTMHITCSYGAGIMTGDPSGNLNATDNGTRAEAAVMVNRYINMIDSEYKKIPETNVTYDKIPEGHPVAVITFSDDRSIELELYPEYAPQTVAHFVAMAKNGVYNEEFDVIGVNGAEHSSIGSICSISSPKTVNATVYGEFSQNGFAQNTLPHVKGTAVMDYMWNYNDGSLDFRILAEDMTEKNGSAAAFGKVVKGMDIIDELVKEGKFAIIQSVVIK